MNHWEKKQHGIVVSGWKLALCQWTNKCRNSLCKITGASCSHMPLGQQNQTCISVCVPKSEKETRDGQSCKMKRKRGRVRLVVSRVELKLGRSLQLSRAKEELAAEVG